MREHYGRHLSFPFRIETDGRTAQVSTFNEHVLDELKQLILTNLGERIFLPEFGTDVRRLVFENADGATAGMTKALLTQAISRWLGHRLTLENLIVEVENATIKIEIQYKPNGSEESRVMVFERRNV